MGRLLKLAHQRLSSFPRWGEPIVPRLLMEVVIDRHLPLGVPSADLFRIGELGTDVWKRFPRETCQRIGRTVVDRVQTRLRELPPSLLAVSLPDPSTVLTLSVEVRTTNTLRRALAARGGAAEGASDDEPWTLERYLGLPRFGGRAMVDLLAAVEANAKLQLPVRLVELPGSRLTVGASQATAARTAYQIASREVQVWGMASIGAIAAQLKGAPGSGVDASFVERVLSQFDAFFWIDRPNGWFWLASKTNPLLGELMRIFSMRRRISFAELEKLVYRASRRGLALSLEGLSSIAAAIPDARLEDDELILDRPRETRPTEMPRRGRSGG